MTEQECLNLMVPPGGRRESKWLGGVIQIRVTRACNLSCFSCTQGSQLSGKVDFMSPEQFEQAVLSLKGYPGVYGTFGGNPAVSKHFVAYCEILRKHVPFEQRGLWCNDLMTPEKGAAARATYNPDFSNLNCHLDARAHQRFREWWPESMPFGLDKDSRHSPPFVAIKDVGVPESEAWELISGCDINKYWSAAISLFRGELRGYFCELAAAQASLHQDEPDYPDTGIDISDTKYIAAGRNLEGEVNLWWRMPMTHFDHQVRKHCFDCGVPLRGHGCDAQASDGAEQVSQTHQGIFKPKPSGRRVELVVLREQLGKPLGRVTHYLQNAGK